MLCSTSLNRTLDLYYKLNNNEVALSVKPVVLNRLKEDSKWSQSYYAYLCGGELSSLTHDTLFFEMLGKL